LEEEKQEKEEGEMREGGNGNARSVNRQCPSQRRDFVGTAVVGRADYSFFFRLIMM